MNDSQRIDHAYHEEKLVLLIAQRGKLHADSDQTRDSIWKSQPSEIS